MWFDCVWICRHCLGAPVGERFTVSKEGSPTEIKSLTQGQQTQNISEMQQIQGKTQAIQ